MSAPKVLLVEDERIVALNLKRRLERLGYDVPSIAASCEQVLAAINDNRPDIVLMDVNIEGDVDGIDTVRRIPAELLIPVIYLTAYSEDATLKRAAETKPYGYLVKPFSERELHATIQMALQRHATEVALKASEAELHQSREDFRYLFIRNPLPMWVFELETLKFLDVNLAAVEVYGYPREEMLAMTIADIRPPEEVARIGQYFTDHVPDYLAARNIRHRRKNGEIFEVDAFSYPITFDKHPARMVVAIDVTAKNRAEEKLRQAQRMEAIGHLTGGVAHDFNNLLAVIFANLEFLTDELRENASVAAMISDALHAARRGALLTSRLLAFSRQQALEPQTVSPKLLLTNLLALLRRTVDETIEISLKTEPAVWPISVDPNQLENAIVNLVVNARDAMPDGGRVSIEAFNLSIDAHYCELNPDLRPGDYVLIVVTDTGTGMTPEVVGRVFEPFFTTKAVGKGTGLGLSMVFGFLQQSGGQAKIYSELGRGTSVKLYLPRAETEKSVTVDKPTKVAEIAARHNETVLLVEDDDAVRRSALNMLKRLGYRVLDAADGPAALAIARVNLDIELLLTDVVLPRGLNGPALAGAVKKLVPSAKVLYMSGYTRDTVIHNGVLDEGVHLLMKPFSMTDLGIKLREVLASS